MRCGFASTKFYYLPRLARLQGADSACQKAQPEGQIRAYAQEVHCPVTVIGKGPCLADELRASRMRMRIRATIGLLCELYISSYRSSSCIALQICVTCLRECGRYIHIVGIRCFGIWKLVLRVDSVDSLYPWDDLRKSSSTRTRSHPLHRVRRLQTGATVSAVIAARAQPLLNTLMTESPSESGKYKYSDARADALTFSLMFSILIFTSNTDRCSRSSSPGRTYACTNANS